jgi:hypothetical protein
VVVAGPTLEGRVALQGLLDPEAGQTLLAALDPLARPANAEDPRSGGQRRADALVELARRTFEAGQLPQSGGVRPQLNVVVDLDSLLGHPGAVGGDAGWAGPLSPEACRRLACNGAVTRVLVTRQPSGHPGDHGHDPGGHHPHDDLRSEGDLAEWLRTAMDRLPPALGGAPSQPLDVGRVDGGPTDLENLALVCRAHHRAVHEGGWQLTRGPDGHFTATPPHRDHRRYRAAA